VAGRHDNAPAASSPPSSYAAGYSACAAAAVRHITQLDHVDPATRRALAARLDDHLAARRRRRDVTAAAVTSPRRRPLADIQPTASRQPPTVSRSVTASAACDCVAFPFPVDALSTELVAMVTMTSTTVQQQQQQHGHVYQQVRETGDDDFVSSRQVAPRGDSRCAHPVASGNVREPMWRPW